MTPVRTTIGIDFTGELFYVARVEYQTGRPEIKALHRLEHQHLGEPHLTPGGEYVISIPDELVIVKHFTLNGQDDIELKASFELAQTLPDEPDRYLFNIVQSGLDRRFLAMAVRRDRLDDFMTDTLGDKAAVVNNSRYEMRAAALACGYTEFCRKTGGDLICLADFARSNVSLAFIYQNALVDLCYMPLKKSGPDTSEDFSRIAVDLKTLVNFRTARLFSEGVTTPLSCLVISGETASDDTVEKLRRFFSIDISRPNINTGFLSGQSEMSSVPLEKYLVALGLAGK